MYKHFTMLYAPYVIQYSLGIWIFHSAMASQSLETDTVTDSIYNHHSM